MTYGKNVHRNKTVQLIGTYELEKFIEHLKMLRQTDPRVLFLFQTAKWKKRHKTKVGMIGSISVRRLLPRGIHIPSRTLKLPLKIHF